MGSDHPAVDQLEYGSCWTAIGEQPQRPATTILHDSKTTMAIHDTTRRPAIEQTERVLTAESTMTTSGSRCGIAEVNELAECPTKVTVPALPSSKVRLADNPMLRY